MSIPTISYYDLPLPHALPRNRVSWQVEPGRAVLLIHDMQEYFLRFYGSDNPLLQRLIANIVAIREWADLQGVPVVYTAQPAEQKPEERALLNDMWGPGVTAADPSQTRVTPALTPNPHDTVLVKWRYSAFQRSPLQSLLQDWQRDQLIIVGVYAHIGCLTTALDSFMRDIQPFVVGDAVADFSAAEHETALHFIAGRCGAVVATQDILAIRKRVEKPLDFSMAWLKQQVLPFIDEAEGDILDDDNLIDYGLNSIQVMSLVGRWQQLGLSLSFEDLAQQASLGAWQQLILRQLEVA